MDLFASRLTAQLPQYVSWRPDPAAFHIDALTLHWKSLMGYAPPPPLQSNSSSSQQGDSRQCRSGSCGSNLASSAEVAHPIESSSQQPCVTSTQSTPHAGSLRSKQGTSDVPSPSSDRVSNLQQYYQTEGFPGQVTKLLLSATRSSTRKAYQSAWSRWSRWCAKGNLSCFSPTLKNS